MEQQTGYNLGKEYIKVVYRHSAYLTYMQNTSCEMPGQGEAQDEIKISRRNINSFRYTDDTTLMAESKKRKKEKEKKEPLDESEKESEKKIGLKLNIQKKRSWHPVPSVHGK